MSNKILVINKGSSSLKFALFENTRLYLKGEINDLSVKVYLKGTLDYEEKYHAKNQPSDINLILNTLEKYNITIVDAIGHRLVFGRDIFQNPVIINKQVLDKLKDLSVYDMLHMPGQIVNIEPLQQKFPNIVQVACFDTCFHVKMPKKASMFALEKKLYEEGVKRYGFHGLSFESIINNDKVNYNKIVVAHLGSGCSICAIKDKVSIDTTMGLTSLGGVPMMKRSGDLDPGVFLYLLKEKKYTIEMLAELLYEKSGLKSLSGIIDMKTLIEKAKVDPISFNALELFCYQISKIIAAYISVLKGVDAIIFTGGIGENSAIIRKNISDQLSFFDIHLNNLANKKNENIISNDKSKIKILVIPANEELVIARHVMRLVFLR